MSVFNWLLDLIYPPKCPFCGALLKKAESDLCRKCRFALPEVEAPFKRGEFYDKCWSVYFYEEFVAESMKRYKFHGMQHYSAVYGRLLAMRLLRGKVKFDVLTWVPTSEKRKKTRGYDQTFLLAKSVAQELGVECVRTLNKTVHNEMQSGLKDAAARRANVLGVFEAYREEHFRKKRVLLIDDVVTSGATLTECARVLLTAGASSVECATFTATRQKETKQ